MLASGSVGFSEECEGIIDLGELGCLAYLPLVVLVGSFQNGLLYVIRERLISVCGIDQLGANPSFCDFFVSVYSVIYVPGAFCQCSVGLLDSLHSLVGPVDRVAAQLGKLSEVAFRLPLLSSHGSDPNRGVGQCYRLLRCGRSIGDLKQIPRGFQSEHVEVG